MVVKFLFSLQGWFSSGRCDSTGTATLTVSAAVSALVTVAVVVVVLNPTVSFHLRVVALRWI